MKVESESAHQGELKFQDQEKWLQLPAPVRQEIMKLFAEMFKDMYSRRHKHVVQ